MNADRDQSRAHSPGAADPEVDDFQRSLYLRRRVLPLVLLVIAAGGAATCAMQSPNWAFVTAGWQLPFVVGLGVRALVLRSRRSALAAAVALGLFGLSVFLMGHHIRSFERRAQPTIDAIERFRVENGQYPQPDRSSRSEVRGIPLPRCTGSRMVALYMVFAADGGDAFSLTCLAFGPSKHEYRSDLNRWIIWD
jgi:hypothetical protein